MKIPKFFIFSFVFTFLLAACGPFSANLERIGGLEFNLDISDGPFELRNETMIKIEPDYDLRSLSVVYKKDYKNHDGDISYDDVEAEGVLGGNFFDRFEKIITVFADPDFDQKTFAVSTGFDVTILPLIDGEEERTIMMMFDDEDLVREFFLDISEKFNVDIY